MRAMSTPMLSHLDPDFIAIMDDTRARFGRQFNIEISEGLGPLAGRP